jgi:cell volume regulation protein A
MTTTLVVLLFIGSLLLFLSIFASKSTQRFGVPALIVFLAIGMLAGADGPGGIYFNDPFFAQALGIIALNFILFSGGLDTKWQSVKPIFYQGLSLATLGVLLTALLTGLFAHWILGLSLIEGLLLGSIVSSTDAAAVFSILRGRGVGLKGNLRPTLELESGSNDPMAYFLTTSLIAIALQPEMSAWTMVPTFFMQMSIGGAMGYLLGKLMIRLINKINLEVDGLYPVLLIAFMFFAYSATELIYGNGFLAVYIAAVVLGNASFIHKKSMLKFFDASAWLMQILMFLTLGLLVFPSEMGTSIIPGLAISIFMILVARPVTVFISLAFSKLRVKDKLFISWVGLRGAVPIIFATYPLIAGLDNANVIFNIVFFISVISVTVQGTTLPVVAKWLKRAVPESMRRKFPLDIELADEVRSELAEIEVTEDSFASNRPIVEIDFPKAGLIVMIKRQGKYLMPNGSTVLLPGDLLTVMANGDETMEAICDRVSRPNSVSVKLNE